MHSKKHKLWVPLSLALLMAACLARGDDARRRLLVYCGSANKPPMEEIAAAYQEKTGIKVDLLFGGSGSLLAQMSLSGQGEIYLPGSPDYIIIGERQKLLIAKSDRIVAYLVPAIITPAGNPAGIKDLEDLARPEARVGLGNPETVCLGLYGIELLEKNKLLAAVMNHVVTLAGSCSRTANLAAMGQVDAILGWSVFHDWNPSRMECIPIRPDRIPRISYVPIAIPACTRDLAMSHAFIDYVLSPAGVAAYKKYGYITERDEALKYAPAATIGGEYRLPEEYYELLRTQFSGQSEQGVD